MPCELSTCTYDNHYQTQQSSVKLLLWYLHTATWQLGWTNAICSSSFLPPTFDLGPFLPGLEPIPHQRDILVESYRFSCEGTITHWEAYTSGSGRHSIEFQVWRDLPSLLRYELVGINTFSEARPSNGRLRLQVPEGERIQARPGDFVGFSMGEGTEANPFQIQRISGYYLDYNQTERGYDGTPQELRLVRLAADGRLCFITSTSPSNFTAAPLINAVLNSEYHFFLCMYSNYK